MLKMFLTIALMLISVVTACATPTPTVSTLAWDAYTDSNGVGFYIYWRQNNASSSYNNTNRVQVTGTTTVQDAISAVIPATHPSSVCFVLTAYDSANNESAFSNEACGFVGLNSPAGVKGQ